MATFGEFLKKEREKKEMNQSDFGQEIGIIMTDVSKIENGRKKADIVASADGRIAGRLLEVNIYTDSYQKAEMRVNKMMLDSSALGSQVLAGNVVISSEATLLFELN